MNLPANFSLSEYDRECRTIYHIVETYTNRNHKIPVGATDDIAERIIDRHIDTDGKTGSQIREEFQFVAGEITPLYVEIVYRSEDL